MDNAKKNRVSIALYIALALIVATVVCMTVIGVITNSRKGEQPIKSPSTSASDTTSKLPSNDKPSVTTKPDSTEATDKGDEINDIDNAENTNTPLKMNYTNPIEVGHFAKEFTIDMPVYSLTMNDYRTHSGIDIACESGCTVMAMAEGVIDGVYNDAMMGNCISISHPNGLTSYYMGLSDEKVDGITEGAPVYCGQVIGSVGDSTLVELAEETHVHFEIKDENGAYVDPLRYVSYDAISDIDVQYED